MQVFQAGHNCLAGRVTVPTLQPHATVVSRPNQRGLDVGNYPYEDPLLLENWTVQLSIQRFRKLPLYSQNYDYSKGETSTVPTW